MLLSTRAYRHVEECSILDEIDAPADAATQGAKLWIATCLLVRQVEDLEARLRS